MFAFASAMHLPTLPRLSLPTLTEPHWRVLTARLFVGLGLVFCAAMPFWPYTNSCSWGLMLYLSAVLLVVITGVWGAKLAWDARLGATHTLALCIVFWGLTLVAAEVLPRVGYAQTQEPWFCPW
jgi:heme A synthase